MFFFIGGLSPRVKQVYEPSKRVLEILRSRPNAYCNTCHRITELDVYRQDYWVNAFFLPLARVKKGHEYIGCSECKTPPIEDLSIVICRICEAVLYPAMEYCPNCGNKVKFKDKE